MSSNAENNTPIMPTMPSKLEDSYAPNWVPYFESNGAPKPDVEIAVECGICRKGLAITQCADRNHESFAVLPCGHVFGYVCIERWFTQTRNCPTCRRGMNHLACGHQVPINMMQGGYYGFNIHKVLPSVMKSEENLAVECDFCQRRRASGILPDHESNPYGPSEQPSDYELSQRWPSTLTPEERTRVRAYVARMRATGTWVEPWANWRGRMPNLVLRSGYSWNFTREDQQDTERVRRGRNSF